MHFNKAHAALLIASAGALTGGTQKKPFPKLRPLKSALAAKPDLFGINEEAIRLAEMVTDAVECAEKIRFANNGTEAAMFATRALRTYRRRDKILKFFCKELTKVEAKSHALDFDELASAAGERPGVSMEWVMMQRANLGCAIDGGGRSGRSGRKVATTTSHRACFVVGHGRYGQRGAIVYPADHVDGNLSSRGEGPGAGGRGGSWRGEPIETFV